MYKKVRKVLVLRWLLGTRQHNFSAQLNLHTSTSQVAIPRRCPRVSTPFLHHPVIFTPLECEHLSDVSDVRQTAVKPNSRTTGIVIHCHTFNCCITAALISLPSGMEFSRASESAQEKHFVGLLPSFTVQWL